LGLTPHLRYNFATGTRWVPFADLGAGVTATSEHAPDLGGAFEFNLQAATGVHWFVRDNRAVTLEARYLRVSSTGLYTPNLGLNTVAGLVGLTWVF
jgi:lipid A 3-O-deacylase